MFIINDLGSQERTFPLMKLISLSVSLLSISIGANGLLYSETAR